MDRAGRLKKIRELRRTRKAKARDKKKTSKSLLKTAGALIAAMVFVSAISKGLRERRRVQEAEELRNLSSQTSEDTTTGFEKLLKRMLKMYKTDDSTPVMMTKARLKELTKQIADQADSSHPPYVMWTLTEASCVEKDTLTYARDSTLIKHLSEFIIPRLPLTRHGIIYIMLYQDDCYQPFSLGSSFEGVRVPDWFDQFTVWAYVIIGRELELAQKLVAAMELGDNAKTQKVTQAIKDFGDLHRKLSWTNHFRYSLQLPSSMDDLAALKALTPDLERTFKEIARIGAISVVNLSKDDSFVGERSGILQRRDVKCILQDDCMLICGIPQAPKTKGGWSGIQELSSVQVQILEALSDDPDQIQAVKSFSNALKDFDDAKPLCAKAQITPKILKSLVDTALSSIKVRLSHKTGEKDVLTCQDFAMLFMEEPEELLHVMTPAVHY